MVRIYSKTQMQTHTQQAGNGEQKASLIIKRKKTSVLDTKG